jgi:DNA-binding transcriptional MerR regulator
MKRGGGRRYYRPDDIDLLRGIRHLLYGEGYTIRGVQRILGDEGIKYVQTAWQQSDTPQPAGREAAQATPEPIEEEDDEPVAAPGRRGLRDRLTSLIGEDLNERDPPQPRHDPPLQPAPEPHIDAGERVLPVKQGPSAPARVTAVAPQPADGFPREDLRKLQAALHELAECRKLLMAGLAAQMPDAGASPPE